jgi:hypothetical protein
LLFNFASENTIRKVQENKVELKLIDANQLLAFEADFNLFGDNIVAIKEKEQKCNLRL